MTQPAVEPFFNASQFLYVSTSLDHILLDDDSTQDHVDPTTKKIYRRLDPAFYSWIRASMEKLKTKKDRLDPAWIDLKARFAILHTWAVDHYGMQALVDQVNKNNTAQYSPPRPKMPDDLTDDAVAGLCALLSSHPDGVCEIEVKCSAGRFTLVVAYSEPKRTDRLEISLHDFSYMVEIKRLFPAAHFDLFDQQKAATATAAKSAQRRFRSTRKP
jgi:hypothetical protein